MKFVSDRRDVMRWMGALTLAGALATSAVSAQDPEPSDVQAEAGAPIGELHASDAAERIHLRARGLPDLVVELPRGWTVEVAGSVHHDGWIASPAPAVGPPGDRIVLWAVPLQICEQPAASELYVRVGSVSVPVSVDASDPRNLRARYCWWHVEGRAATALGASVEARTDSDFRRYLELSTSYRPLDGSEVHLMSPAQEDDLRQTDLIRTVFAAGLLSVTVLCAGLALFRRRAASA